jgi:hypothetical protein
VDIRTEFELASALAFNGGLMDAQPHTSEKTTLQTKPGFIMLFIVLFSCVVTTP